MGVRGSYKIFLLVTLVAKLLQNIVFTILRFRKIFLIQNFDPAHEKTYNKTRVTSKDYVYPVWQRFSCIYLSLDSPDL